MAVLVVLAIPQFHFVVVTAAAVKMTDNSHILSVTWHLSQFVFTSHRPFIAALTPIPITFLNHIRVAQLLFQSVMPQLFQIAT
jgi:hypothetical protein